MCQTGTKTSTTTIVLAVVLPVCALGIGLGIMGWQGYKRNKKEVLNDVDDDNADYIGDISVVPEPDLAPPGKAALKDGGLYYNPSANNSSVNPFTDPKEKRQLV
ncbi:unnamed protein product [Ambrosiozyma monospora]|nr:unnamed protein product [Ambrosiozyma monospora]